MQTSSRTGPARPGARWPAAVALAVFNLLLYAPSLGNSFSLDDYNWLERARFASSWGRFVLGVEPGEILNPLPRALFQLLGWLGGGAPVAFHLAALGLHILTVSLLLVLVDRVTGDRSIALLAAILFSLETSGHEAVFWIAALSYPLSGALGLCALIAAERYLGGGGKGPALGAGLCSLAGLLTKASCAAMLPVMLLLPGPRRRRVALAVGLATLVVVVAAANLAAGAGDSYLVSRGHYRAATPHRGPELQAAIAPPAVHQGIL